MDEAEQAHIDNLEDVTVEQPDKLPPLLASWKRDNADEKPVSWIFNGTYTLENTKRQTHRTFVIKTQSMDSSFAPGKRVIALLTSEDNESGFRTFGFVDDNGIAVFKKHRKSGRNTRYLQGIAFNQLNKYEQYVAMIVDLVIKGEKSTFYINNGLRLLCAAKCIRCNRKLTTPKSIKTGIGPICAGEKE